MRNKKNVWLNNHKEFAQNRIDSRQYILLPEIAKIIHDLKASNIFDYGCGEGYLSKHLINKRINLSLYDINTEMTKLAESNAVENKIKSISIYNSENKFLKNSFDCVVLSLVLMTIENEKEYMSVLENCKKILKNSGKLIIGLTHPCFRQSLFSTHHTNYTLGTEFDYFNNKFPFDVYLRTSKSERSIHFKDFHYNLTYTFATLKVAGFIVEDLIELKDCSIENSYYNKFLSPYIILTCIQK